MQGARELADGGASRRHWQGALRRSGSSGNRHWSAVEEVRGCVGGADDAQLTQMRRRLGATGLGEEAWWPVGHKEG